MPREQFFYSDTPPLFAQLEELARKSGVSRGRAFEDWLTAMVCALAAETKEDEYLAMVERHKHGEPGRRGADRMARMFAELVEAMERSDADILGDLYQGSITYGENGQYFTPQAISCLMAELSVDPAARPSPGKPVYINDPCCGTGRMLLEASKINPQAELVGQDVDARCARITAINLGLRGRYGWVVCGNSLSGDAQFAYRIGSFFHEGPRGLRRGVIREVAPYETPVPLIAVRVRERARTLLDAGGDAQNAPEERDFNVIEVPQWLARLETPLTEQPPPQADAGPSPASDPSPPHDDPPPGKQQLLF